MKGHTVFPKKLQPLDRAALLLIVVLSLLIGLLLLGGSRTAPRVRDFTWQNKQVGAEDTAFILTFSRPMDQASVEQNLRIVPPLPGKFSWAGRRMAYTLESPAPYGETFRLEMRGARDRFTSAENEQNRMPLYVGEFRTRDRAFVYLGVKGEQEGRLVLQNLTTQAEEILTPPELVVMDFEPYPDGDRVLFSASDRADQAQGFLNQRLYTVTTGIQIQAPASAPGQRSSNSLWPERAADMQPPGQMTQLLDSDAYQNLKFDLAPDGETVIVQRVNRQDPGDFGLWMVKPDVPPQPIETEPGGDFLITPDSSSIAMTQGQGLAILPLESNADSLDFLPKYGQILSFANDGSAAAMVQFNVDDPTNPTRSLFLVTNQSTETELFRTNGNILSAQFDPTNRMLYSLYTKRLPGDVYVEEPYLAAMPLPTAATSSETAEPAAQKVDLLQLPIQRDLQMSLSPDGLGILFDQVTSTTDEADTGVVRSNEGRTIADSRLWFLPLEINENGRPIPAQPQPLPLEGLRPRWLP
ncbi:hypothetical protein IQ268_01710 [Oculatella sp. LEGE 06141]|uniref:hypothetical protein n=1 Tax=Oculatella sp. LEGE 06141 TaxID=1828648 RepID=UPI00187E00AD|nr:hypothetical protein [Oculatella sp. LEGE 06141]MBE9177290.1 hypothetical protein [Oculatella sp. LEGE 06141]